MHNGAANQPRFDGQPVPKLMSKMEVCQMLNVSKRWLEYKMREGRIEYFKPSARKVYFRLTDVVRFIEDARQ